jgi:hypothetical protein
MSEATDKVVHSKLTTIAGGLSTISGVLLAIVPGDVLATCTEAIAKTQNPTMIGGLLGAGVLLSSVGPSLVGRSKK